MARKRDAAAEDDAPELDPHTIESDRYDRAAIARLRAGSAAWRRLEKDGEPLLPHFDALVDDLFCALFKANVLSVAAAKTPPSTALARRVLAAVLAGPAYPVLRHQALLDESRAGLGAVLLGESLLRALRTDRVLTDEDLLDLFRLAEHEQRARDAEEEADVGSEIAQAENEKAAKGGAGKARAKTLQKAAQAAHLAARGAGGEREQKRRHVEDALARVGSRLDASLQKATADAAVKVADLPDALAAWGSGVGASGPHDASQSIDLGRRLVANPKLKKLAKVFGRVRAQALAVRRRVFERADEEMYEVGRNTGLEDLARLVPHELVACAHPVLRRDFQRRLLDGGLLTYALRGLDSRGHGPMIVCLDVSGSMSGEKELWSKAVALTFVEIARRQRRRCIVLCFSSGPGSLREFDMNPRTPYQVQLEQTLDLAEHFAGGGTDFQGVLDAATAKISTRALRRSDVVLLTDGECAVAPEWLDEFRRAKRKRNFALYTILIDVQAAQEGTVAEMSDRVARVTDLTADAGALFTEARSRRRSAS